MVSPHWAVGRIKDCMRNAETITTHTETAQCAEAIVLLMLRQCFEGLDATADKNKSETIGFSYPAVQ